MTKQEAILKMLTGEKVYHSLFLVGEYVYMKPNDFSIYSEDGVNHGSDFWILRNGTEWDKDWDIFVMDQYSSVK